ncbi:MAG: hypothetical protein E6Q67_07090 [Roseateles sp.]|nr:MAG: hypothetical protein E6Q67_07090 [Roseateles sp.]
MARLKSLGSGALLAAGNVYAALSTFVVLSIVFNSVDLRTFGAISLLLTSVAICQILFNTQSWQGLLNSAVPAGTGLLRRCLAIDVTTAAMGATLLALTHLAFPRALSQDVEAPATLLWLAVNVALIPPGALIAVIRQEGRFAQQALVDISASTLKIAMALVLVRGATSLASVALTLVLPEVLRWCGYLALSSARLARRDEGPAAGRVDTASPSTLRSIYGFSLWGMLTEIIHLPTAHIDKLLVSALLGLESLAIWDILKRCATAVVQATTVINQMLFPYFVRIRHQSTVANLARQCLRQCLLLGGLLLLLYGAATLALPIWFPLAFHVDTAAWPLDHLQRIFGVLALVMTFVLGATPVHPLFLSLRHSSQSFRISLVGSVLFFALSALLLPWWGLFGASLAILGSDAFIILTKARLLHLTAVASRATDA